MAARDARLVFCLRRRPELTRDEFQRYWRERHAPLVAERASVLGITGYRQMHTVPGATVGDAFDGIAELHTDRSAQTADRSLVREAGERLLEDEREFIDLERSPIWHAIEEQVTRGPERGLRVTAVFRSTGGDLDELRRRLDGAARGRRSALLLAPTDAGPDPLALARSSPAAYPLMIETWLGDEPDLTAAVHEMSGHLTAAGIDPEDQLVWCARPHPIVAAD